MKSLLHALALSLAIASQPSFAEDPVFTFEETDPAMAAAIAEARATLPMFLAQSLDADGKSVGGVALKVGMPTEPGSTNSVEHIWITPFARRADGGFIGLLANEPAELGDLFIGDQVIFREDMISDWHVNAPSGRFWGSFTTRVMHASGLYGDTPFDQIFEPDPVPADWK
jgi:uncharacterized protein YegJ (DUF2314 family)